MTAHESTTAAQRKRDGRQLPRYAGDIPLKITREGLSGPLAVNGRCTDVGEVGMGGELDHRLVIGEVVHLAFRLPTLSEPFDLKARVLYRHGNRYGFYFLGLSEGQRAQLIRGCELMAQPGALAPVSTCGS